MNPQGIDHVVVPGSFDPITKGHVDVIQRASRLASKVTVAVAASEHKHGHGTCFSLEERIAIATEALADAGLAQVAVLPLRGLLVEFCEAVGAQAVVKGLRVATDFEYELQQADLNQRLAPNIESVFVMSKPELGAISSSMVREISALGGDVSAFVPVSVIAHLDARFGHAREM